MISLKPWPKVEEVLQLPVRLKGVLSVAGQEEGRKMVFVTQTV